MARDRCRICQHRCERCETENQSFSHPKTDSLCWCCARAVPGKDIEECDWCRSGMPIVGWEAKKTRHIDGSIGYKIISCPLFIKG